MEFLPLELSEVVLVRPRVHADPRGTFLEAWRDDLARAAGLDARFVQDNLSRSEPGVLRGLHYQLSEPQGKLVRCVSGRIFDVAVDLRRSSPNFCRWVGHELDAVTHEALWVPPGFAHGLLVIEGPATVSYRCTTLYHPDADRALAWDDPDLAIAWPLGDTTPILSERDASAPRLADAEVFEAL